MKLFSASIQSDICSSNIEVSENNIHLLHHNVAVCVRHEFTCFAVPPVTHSSRFSVKKGTITALSRLDACIATTVIRLRADGSERVGDHRQKLYNEIFSIYLSSNFRATNPKNWVSYRRLMPRRNHSFPAVSTRTRTSIQYHI